jgi:quercetin dioxygenase-like cupin family protein
MRRQLLTLAMLLTAGLAGYALASIGNGAQPERRPGFKIKTLLEQLLPGKHDNGKEYKAVVVELQQAPGSASKPHRHPGPVIGYVLEGELEVGIDDQPARVYKKGEVWYEPPMALHRVSHNPSSEHPARFLAVLLVPADAKSLVLPEKAKK